jgi:hypothetical protein
VIAPNFIGNVVGNISGNLAAPGTNTQILFNDNNTVGTSNQFTFNKASNLLTVGGNVNSSGLAVTGSSTFTLTLQASGGIQNTPIGNVTASTGQFTTVSSTGNITGAALTANESITSGTTLQALGGIQNTPIGNGTANSGQFTTVSATGNVTGASLTANASITAGTTLSAQGGIQNTPIGNVAPSTAVFTSESVSGNSTVNGLTVNTSVVAITTLQAQGGIQNTPIGNITPSTAQFSTVSASGNVTGAALTANGSITAGASLSAGGGIQNTPIGNTTPSTGQFTTLNTSGNSTVSAITVNGSGTFGSTLSASEGIQNTAIGNVTPNSGSFTTLIASNISVSGNAIVGNLNVLGTITYINSNVTLIVDPIIELNTGPNGAPLSGPAPYDSGLKLHYWAGADRSAFFGRSNSSGYLEYFSNVTSETGNVITGVYGTIKSGNLVLTSNATIPNLDSTNIRNDNYFYANGDPFTGIKVITSSAPPAAGNVVGDQWYNTTNNAMYEYQFDGTNYFWVDITGPAFGYSEQIISNGSSTTESLSPFLLMGA